MANKHRELSATANVAMNMFRAVHIPEKMLPEYETTKKVILRHTMLSRFYTKLQKTLTG